ncbi:MAG TPA: hypothetical protein VKU39_01275 [Streptosporangiaceae bacterium]|nr:hypothetical protein [Streptosporangiaceae bacterium]
MLSSPDEQARPVGAPSRHHGPDLASVHRNLGITDAQFDRAAECLDATLTGLGVPRHLTDRVIGIVGRAAAPDRDRVTLALLGKDDMLALWR